MGARVLVTGATGFLGRAVLESLGAEGIGQGRDAERLAAVSAAGFEAVRWTLPDVAPEDAALDDVEAIVHCAALSKPFGAREAFHRANVLGTQAVLRFAQAQGVRRFVYISSPSVYFALQDQLDVQEDMPLGPPFNAYAESKAAAEALVLEARQLGPVVLRPRGIYGPGDRTLLPRLRRVAAARPLPRFRGGRARIDLTYVGDVVAAVLAALRVGPEAEGRVFNVSGGEVLPIREIVEQTCARVGIVARWRDMPLRPALMAARVAEAVALLRSGQPEPLVTRYGLGLFAFEQSLDLTRAKAELGWSPAVPFAEGLERTFAGEAAP